ncbi:MAG: hypothetical protein D6729_04105 [Deltaproteobacteria bacterium]|nr:MAG: hypothetical protein D6729_04105 [Deltaproteobacteria bacterium]
MSGATFAYLLGMALLYVGRRILGGDTTAATVVTVLANLAFAGSVVLFVQRIRHGEAERRAGWQRAALFAAVGIASLVLWGLSTDRFVEWVGFEGEVRDRWTAVFSALWPIVWLVGTLPLLLIDRALSTMPVVVQPRRVSQATETGLVLALATAFAFPLNYLAARHDASVDLRYVKTTAVGESTRAIVQSLEEPVEAVLFFPPANEVAREVRPYFETLAKASEAFTVREADHDLDLDLAKQYRVSSNGTIALVQGEKVERISVGTDIDKARSTLKKLDREVQGALLKLVKKAQVVYFTVGHGEMSWSGKDLSPARKLSILKRGLDELNYRVKPLGITDGLGREIPSDAAAVVILAPTEPFLPEEIATLRTYLERGGRLLVAFDVDGKRDEALEALLGVHFHPEVLHHDRYFVATTRTDADKARIITNNYSSHPSVSNLARTLVGRQQGLYFPEAGYLEARKDAAPRPTETVRAMSGTWAERTGDHAFDRTREKKRAYAIGMAAEGGEGETKWRIAVFSDGSFAGDEAILYRANRFLFVDTLRWILGEEEISGAIESEEDVRIQHTRDEDRIWFYGTSFAVPLLILGAGLFHVARRRREA